MVDLVQYLEALKTEEGRELIARIDNKLEQVKSMVDVFMVLDDGATSMGKMALQDAWRAFRHPNIAWFEIIEEPQESFKSRIFLFDELIRKAYFDEKIDVRHCLLCRHSYSKHHEDGRLPPWLCFQDPKGVRTITMKETQCCSCFNFKAHLG